MKQMFKPFSEISKPFSIGLKPIEDKQFLQIDKNKEAHRKEKEKLYEEKFNTVFMQEQDTIDAQTEVKELIQTQIKEKILKTQLPPLAQTALHIQDDLVLLRKKEEEWKLVAASICFPSAWNLKEKFGKPINTIHNPVPYMKGQMENRINRIFDALRPNEPLWRQNWSIKNDKELRHDTKEGYEKKFDGTKPVFIRWEYQTLHKLPISKDILFTIKIFIEPIETINVEMKKELKIYYENMGEEGQEYKRIKNDEFEKWITELK